MSELPIHPIGPQPLEVLDTFDFVGPYRDDTDAIEDLTDYLNGYVTPDMPEAQKTPEEFQQLDDIKDAWRQFGLHLGVDLSARMPSNEQVHYLDEDHLKAFHVMHGLEENNRGGTLPTGEVAAAHEANTAAKLGFISHEIGHAIAHHPGRITDSSLEDRAIDEPRQLGFDRSRTGYMVNNTKAFGMFNEYINEKMHRTVRDHYWQNYDSLRDHVELEEEYAGYPGVMPIGDALIAKVAEHNQQTVDEVLYGLMRGALTGDMSAFQPVVETIGIDGMRALANYKRHTPLQGQRVIKKLGMQAMAV